MQAESASDVDYVPLVNVIGLIFQIRDDYMNLQSSQYAKNKGFCEDLTEGKFSFPIIHAIRKDPSNRQLLGILKQKSDDVDVKNYAVAYMRKMGSFEYTEGVLRGLAEQADEMMKSYEDNPMLRAILEKLAI